MLLYFTITLIGFVLCGDLAVARSNAATQECPPPEDIHPCSCKRTSSGIDVICRHFKTDSDLTTILTTLKSYQVNQLQLSNHNATTLPTDLFAGNSIQDLSIEAFEVADASFRRGQKHFQGLENSMHTLEIRKSFKTDGRFLVNLQLGHLDKLEVIILEDNTIPEIGNDWFEKAPDRLNFLLMERNGIEELGDKAFSTLENLKVLGVAGNHFRDITRSMLPAKATQLYSIDLAHNKIRDLPRDIFSDMPSLQEVYINSNVLLTIEEGVWSAVWSRLHEVHLEDNPLRCDENIQWICKSKSPQLHGKCAQPIEKNGISLKDYCQSQ